MEQSESSEFKGHNLLLLGVLGIMVFLNLWCLNLG